MGRRTAIYCKSFRDDFSRLSNLIESRQKFAPEVPMLISVPKSDIGLLYETMEVPSGVWIAADETYVDENNYSQYGWMYQQICKLSLARTDFADSYLVMDSDTYFVAPVSESLFFKPDETLNIVAGMLNGRLTQKNGALFAYLQQGAKPAPPKLPRVKREELRRGLVEVQKIHKGNPSRVAAERAEYIERAFFGKGRNSALRNLHFGPSPLFHAEILQELEKVIHSLGMNWRDLIYLAPWEYKWYGYFATTVYEAGVNIVESPCIHFAKEEDVIYAKSRGISMQTISNRYTALAMASRHFDLEFY